MPGYFSRKNDEPDTEPFRRFYAEGGYVDDTSHDIDDVDAGLYGSQYFAGGGKVFSDFAKTMLGKLRPSKIGPAFDAADEALTGPAAKALEEFTAFPPHAYKNPDFTGIMNPQSLDAIDAIPEMEPLRDLLHGYFGNTMPLARYQRPVPADASPRKFLSWSSDPEFISGYAGTKRVPRAYDEDFIRRMEQEYADTGVANIDKTYRLVNEDGIPQIFRHNEHITDADSVRDYINGLNEDRQWYLDFNDKKLRNVLTEKIPLEDILWGTDRGNQSEFIVRNRGYEEGGSVTDEDWGAYVSQYFDEGGQVEPEGYANGGLIRKFLESVKAPLKAWHGTPHNIDKFDAAKIGTGEGAQVYGHGLYFAENPEVAKWYRESLAGDPYWVHGSERVNPLDVLQSSGLNQDHLFDVGNTILDAARLGAADEMTGSLRALYPEGVVDNYANFIRDNLKLEKPGNLYEVGLHAPRDTLLAWDLPLSQQPEPVLGALDRFGIKPDIQGLRNYEEAINEAHLGKRLFGNIPKEPWNPTGAQLYESSKIVPGDYRDPVAASEALLEAGIPGIRYRDGMSRGRGEVGTHNYVMFPGTEDLIEILGRYAEGGQVEEDVAPPRGYFANGGLVKQLLRAFHGSPAKFDAFAADKIGSAYGGSAQGAGHYFSESEDIAKKYARPDRVEGSPGYMYEVDLNVAPENLLAFDEPFSRQSGNIQDALSRLPVADVSERELLDKFLASDLAKAFPNMSDVRAARRAAEGDSHDVMEWASRNGVPGRAAYNIVGGYGPLGAESLGRDFISRHGREAVQALDIPGLRYVDQESGPLSGATNYVMFPGTENLINLRRRYAEGGEVESRGYFGGC